MVEPAYSDDAARPATGTVPLRVLLVDVSDRGGIARYTDRLAVALEAEGVTVGLAAPRPRATPGLALARRRWGPEMSGRSRVRIRGRRLAELGPAVLLLGRAVARWRGDVVHLQTDVIPPLDALAVRALARRAPVVVTAHDPDPLEGGGRALDREARRWREADAVIIHAESPRGLVERHAPGVPVFVVPVDLALGDPGPPRDEARRRLGLDGAPTALLLGLIRPYKGIDLLAEAWPSVVARVPGARLLLVGEPYGGEELDRLVAAPGVELRPGFVADEEFRAWAAAADVLVLPYHRGSHSGVLHQALAARTPVLASPVLEEEVHRTGAGLVVAMDPAAWTEALVAALTGSPPAVAAAPTGHGTARATVAVYRSVLERRSRRHGRHRPGHPGARRERGARVGAAAPSPGGAPGPSTAGRR